MVVIQDNNDRQSYTTSLAPDDTAMVIADSLTYIACRACVPCMACSFGSKRAGKVTYAVEVVCFSSQSLLDFCLSQILICILGGGFQLLQLLLIGSLHALQLSGIWGPAEFLTQVFVQGSKICIRGKASLRCHVAGRCLKRGDVTGNHT